MLLEYIKGSRQGVWLPLIYIEALGTLSGKTIGATLMKLNTVLPQSLMKLCLDRIFYNCLVFSAMSCFKITALFFFKMAPIFQYTSYYKMRIKLMMFIRNRFLTTLKYMLGNICRK